VVLVPTIGALHEGYLSLNRSAAALSFKVVVTIFVNPAQFAAGEDLNTYPRTLQSDLNLLKQVQLETKVDIIVYHPRKEDLYREGEGTL
jgi:pantoate--beta-alanine ligase